ncbi:hypothetical protein LPUS_03195 [Lasallia pustulata]|uniref:Uncharacterized protein n=1 Tax=Lasallia pustulata TaxID=136370 RepID=A0A1W5CUU0_9LECA|nr:hypothetical protein LPUS_03195 [Lasallia pustulata]
MMDSEDGQVFIKNLAQFVRTHEKALANALQLRKQGPKHGPSSLASGEASLAHLSNYHSSAPTSSTSSILASAFSLGSLNFASQNIKPAKLTLTPHHLFYLLSRVEELGIAIGPMNVRLENIHADNSPANYVSFLSQSQRSKGRSDRDSIHSVSSVRSVMSGMSTLWSNLGMGSSGNAARAEKAKAQMVADLKYLYSAFTKVPCLRLSPDRRARLIRGYEEFPFDTAVPLLAFKNLSALEICDVDFRQFFGWDRLAEQLRSLTVKRANLEDPTDLLVGIVLDDMDKRRRRSTKAQYSPGTPGYVEDIVIDGSGPGYSERRQLMDRVPEPEGVPIVRPLPMESHLRSPSDIRESVVPLVAGENEFKRHETHESAYRVAQGEVTVGSGRRKKGPRRRIVDLSGTESSPAVRGDVPIDIPPTPPQRKVTDSNIESGPDQGSPPAKTALHSTLVDQSASPVKPPRLETSISSPDVHTASGPTDKPTAVANDLQNLNLSGEAYRKKIEALKSEVGNGWLSVLSEDGWDGQRMPHAAVPGGNFNHISAIRPNISNLRATRLLRESLCFLETQYRHIKLGTTTGTEQEKTALSPTL